MAASVVFVSEADSRGREMYREMPPAFDHTDYCGALPSNTGISCSRVTNHSGPHAAHSEWGRNSMPESRVTSYWVRGD